MEPEGDKNEFSPELIEQVLAQLKHVLGDVQLEYRQGKIIDLASYTIVLGEVFHRPTWRNWGAELNGQLPKPMQISMGRKSAQLLAMSAASRTTKKKYWDQIFELQKQFIKETDKISNRGMSNPIELLQMLESNKMEHLIVPCQKLVEVYIQQSAIIEKPSLYLQVAEVLVGADKNHHAIELIAQGAKILNSKEFKEIATLSPPIAEIKIELAFQQKDTKMALRIAERLFETHFSSAERNIVIFLLIVAEKLLERGEDTKSESILTKMIDFYHLKHVKKLWSSSAEQSLALYSLMKIYEVCSKWKKIHLLSNVGSLLEFKPKRPLYPKYNQIVALYELGRWTESKVESYLDQDLQQFQSIIQELEELETTTDPVNHQLLRNANILVRELQPALKCFKSAGMLTFFDKTWQMYQTYIEKYAQQYKIAEEQKNKQKMAFCLARWHLVDFSDEIIQLINNNDQEMVDRYLPIVVEKRFLYHRPLALEFTKDVEVRQKFYKVQQSPEIRQLIKNLQLWELYLQTNQKTLMLQYYNNIKAYFDSQPLKHETGDHTTDLHPYQLHILYLKFLKSSLQMNPVTQELIKEILTLIPHTDNQMISEFALAFARQGHVTEAEHFLKMLQKSRNPISWSQPDGYTTRYQAPIDKYFDFYIKQVSLFRKLGMDQEAKNSLEIGFSFLDKKNYNWQSSGIMEEALRIGQIKPALDLLEIWVSTYITHYTTRGSLFFYSNKIIFHAQEKPDYVSQENWAQGQNLLRSKILQVFNQNQSNPGNFKSFGSLCTLIRDLIYANDKKSALNILNQVLFVTQDAVRAKLPKETIDKFQFDESVETSFLNVDTLELLMKSDSIPLPGAMSPLNLGNIHKTLEKNPAISLERLYENLNRLYKILGQQNHVDLCQHNIAILTKITEPYLLSAKQNKIDMKINILIDNQNYSAAANEITTLFNGLSSKKIRFHEELDAYFRILKRIVLIIVNNKGEQA